MSLTVKQLQVLSSKDLSQLRGHEVPRQRKLADWQEPKSMRIPRYKTREGMSQAHLANVRAVQVCLACCRRGPVDPHHLQHGVTARGFGMRAPDAHVVPLCRRCHDALHALGSRREPEFFLDHGLQAPEDEHWIARRLWKNRTSADAMWVVLEANIARRHTAH